MIIESSSGSSLPRISAEQSAPPTVCVSDFSASEQEFFPEDFAQNIRVDEESEAQIVQLERRGATSHAYRPHTPSTASEFQGNFWTSQTIFKNSIAAKLRTLGLGERADDLEKCHTHITYAQCSGCRSVSKFLNRCDKFYCPECQPRLSRERKESIEWWTKEVQQPKHVVLTIRNTDTISKAHVQFIKKAFSKLRRTKFARNWIGGFYSLEVTNEGRGWHLHIHALVDARYIDARRLAEEWEKATKGAGYIVKVKDCRNRSYLQEVTKYAVKGNQLSEWSPDDILAFILAFEGVRQFGVFGSLYAKRTEWKEWLEQLQGAKGVCKCGCSAVRFFTEPAWEEHVAQLVPNARPIPPPPQIHPEFGFARQLSQDKLKWTGMLT